jgi:hypothetical protein
MLSCLPLMPIVFRLRSPSLPSYDICLTISKGNAADGAHDNELTKLGG